MQSCTPGNRLEHHLTPEGGVTCLPWDGERKEEEAPWDPGKLGRGSRKGAPVQVGNGCWKTPDLARLSLVTAVCRAQGMLGGAVPQQLCAAVPCRCSSSGTLEGERGGDVPKAWLLWEKGWLCLLILLCFVILPKRKRVVIWKVFFIAALKWQLFRQVEITALKKWQFVQ